MGQVAEPLDQQQNRRITTAGVSAGDSATGVWEWYPATNEVSLDTRCLDMLGLSAETFDGTAHSLAAVLFAEELPIIRQKLARAVEHRSFYHAEFRVRRPDGMTLWLLSIAQPLLDANGSVIRLNGVIVDITTRKQAEQQLQYLQQVSSSLAEAQTLEEVRQIILSDVLSALGADGGSLRRVTEHGLVVGTNDFGFHTHEEDLRRYGFVPFTTDHPAIDAFHTGKAIFIGEAKVIRERYPDLAESIPQQTQATAHLPLKRGDRVFGVLSVTFIKPRRWNEAERGFAQTLVNRAAVSYERARLFEAERQAREWAERLQAVAAALSAAVTPAEVNEAVLNNIAAVTEDTVGQGVLGTQAVTLYVLGGDRLDLAGRTGTDSSLITLYHHIPLSAPVPAAEAVRNVRPIWIRSKADFIGQYPHLEDQINQLGTEAAASLPVSFKGQVLGGLNFAFVHQLQFDTGEQGFLLALATLVAQALERSRLFEAEQDARQRLEETNAVLAQALEAARMVAWDTTEDRLTLSANAAALLGSEVALARSAQAGKAYIHPEDLEAKLESFRLALANESDYHAVYRFWNADRGEWIWLEDHGRVRYQAGQPVGIGGVTQNITERKQIEAALRASETRFRAVQETSIDGFMVFESVRDDAGQIVDFRWVYANEAAERIVGQPRISFLGHRLLEKMPGNRTEGLFDAYVHVVETSEPWTKEFEYQHEGLDAYIRLVVAKAGDGFAVSFADLSDRKRAEQRVRESEEKFRTLADNISQLTWMTDETGSIFWYNQRWYEYTGTTLETVQDWGWQVVHHPDYIEGVIERFRHSLDTGEPWEDTFPLRAKDGQYRWFLSRALPIRDETGRIVRWFGTNTDVMEQRSAEQALRDAMEREQVLRVQAEEASHLKDEFLATVSHELRTPLTSFLGYAQLLQARKRDEAYVARAVEKMVRSARMQAQLIEDLLDVSRVVSGKLRIEPTPIDFITVVHAALDTVRPAIEAKNLQLDIDMRPEASAIIGDANRLQQVVWNLLLNAVKFTPPEGLIQVRLVPHDRDAELTISDTGRGISAAFLPYVFDHFRQAESTSTRAYGGLGLGLAIVRHLTELHGGSVQAESSGEGQGATFTVRLPIQDRGEPTTPAHEIVEIVEDDIAMAYPPELRGLRVLIVDDQEDILELLRDVFAPCGAIVQECSSARDALKMLREWQPDVLLSDIAMPEEDGYWLIEHVRALAPNDGGSIPAIALTAYVRVEERVRVLAAGFQRYLPKPIVPSELFDLVVSLTRRAEDAV